jgi:hypothetical protein
LENREESFRFSVMTIRSVFLEFPFEIFHDDVACKSYRLFHIKDSSFAKFAFLLLEDSVYCPSCFHKAVAFLLRSAKYRSEPASGFFRSFTNDIKVIVPGQS